MTLTASDKAAIVAMWSKVSSSAEALGAEALERLFLSFPQTKTYFSHMDLTSGSADLRTQGGKILGAIGEASKQIDNLSGCLSNLSDLHAYNLRVDPGNFQLLSHSIQVVMAVHYPADFTPATQAAWDKFLAAVSTVLTSKYR
ncbi:hypothetical protein FKM82_003100 [Ascaphus truei]